MTNARTAHRPEFNYVRGISAIRDLTDNPRGPREIALLPWQYRAHRLDRAHLVLTFGGPDNPYLGSLMASDLDIPGERSLLLQRAGTPPGNLGTTLTRCMIAFLLLRLAGFEEMPASMMVGPRDDGLGAVLVDLSQRLQGARCAPERGMVVSLATAALAHRIRHHASTYASDKHALPAMVLDLRGTDELSLVEAARRIYRTRLPRAELSASMIRFPAPAVQDGLAGAIR